RLAVDALGNEVARRLQRRETEQALALDVGADAERTGFPQQPLGNEALARSRQPVRDREARIGAGYDRGGDAQVAGGVASALHRDALRFGERAHLGADERPRNEEEAQRRKPGVLAARLEVAIEEAEREVAAAVREQVHREKRGVV